MDNPKEASYDPYTGESDVQAVEYIQGMLNDFISGKVMRTGPIKEINITQLEERITKAENVLAAIIMALGLNVQEVKKDGGADAKGSN